MDDRTKNSYGRKKMLPDGRQFFFSTDYENNPIAIGVFLYYPDDFLFYILYVD